MTTLNSKQAANRNSGFTFVEMLVAVALSSVCLGAGALALQSISTNAKRTTSIVEIEIGTHQNQAFYGNASSSIRTYLAPNYGKLIFAQEMRERIVDDANRATAIFCLPRAEGMLNSIRPTELNVAGRPKLDSPAVFREYLVDNYSSTAGTIYGSSDFRTEPASNMANTTIYVLGQSNEDDKINVNSIYEIDFVDAENDLAGATSFPGTYSTVRRYVGDDLTHYYDIVYKRGADDSEIYPFKPQFVAFEQESRKNASETPAIQEFQVARKSPFYLVWLPDPSINPFDKPTIDPPLTPAYKNMVGKTSFTVVIPMFPSL